MKKKFLLSALLLFSICAYSQKAYDYVINTKGDTLKCKINKPLLSGYRYTLPGDTAKSMETDDVKEYYVAKKNLRVRAVYIGDKKNPQFIDVVENGPLSLYQVVTRYYGGMYGTASSTTTWYIGKNSDRVTELKTNGIFASKSRQERQGDFADMLKDKPELYEKFMAEKKFSFDFIKNLVHVYNTGKGLNDEN